MPTITITANANLASLAYAADDDLVIAPPGTSPVTLTVDSNPNALPAIRSITCSSQFGTFKVRNAATAFSAGNMWRLNFTNPGTAVGSLGTFNFGGLATFDIEGEFLICYTATGTASETILDASNVLGVDIDFPYAIQAETTPGAGDWQWIPVGVVGGVGNGFLTHVNQANFGTGYVGRVLFYDHTTRLLRTGNGTNGSLFAAGTRFRIPNIYIHLPPFTMTTAAGWTTGTGSQPVVSSTNAPVRPSGNPNWLVGSEVINVSALPSGTSITVNNRASDGTTAVAHPAGTVMWALPDPDAVIAGRNHEGVAGRYLWKRCFFGRWWAWRNRNTRLLSMEEAACVHSTSTTASPTGPELRYLRALVYANPARGAQFGHQIGDTSFPVSVDGLTSVGQASTAATASYLFGIALFAVGGCRNLERVKRLRAFKLGMPGNVSWWQTGVALSVSTYADKKIENTECVGCRLEVTAGVGLDVVGYGYSSTSGINNTVMGDIAASFPPGGGLVSNCIFRDFYVLEGGLAPYEAWFFANAENMVAHNVVGGSPGVKGSPRSINSQGHTRQVASLSGGGGILAGIDLSNMRNAVSQVSNFFVNGTVRNLRTSLAATGASIQTTNSGNTVSDFAPVAFGGFDGPVIVAEPASYPVAAGRLLFANFSQQINQSLYEFSGGAYFDSVNQRLFYPNAGNSVIVRSVRPVTGISAIPSGGTYTFFGGNFQADVGATIEFRLCNWGDDVTTQPWAALTGANMNAAFNALTGYSSGKGLDIQLRLTAQTTIANRQLGGLAFPVTMDSAYNPYVGTVPVSVAGATPGALMALDVGSTRIGTAVVSAGGTATIQGPYDFDDVAVSGTVRVRALTSESYEAVTSWKLNGTSLPAATPALSGYVAGPATGVAFNKATKTVTVTAAMNVGTDLWSRWRRYIVQLANFDAVDSWSRSASGALDLADWNLVVNGVVLTGDLETTGLVSFLSGGSISGRYTDANGTQAAITVTGLQANSRVQIFNVTDATELQNDIIGGTSTGLSLVHTADKTIRVRVAKEGFLPVELVGVFNAGGVTFLVEQDTDTVWAANGVNGVDCTEFTADYPNLQIDSDDADGVTSVARIYAWSRWANAAAADGIRLMHNAVQAINDRNYLIDTAVVNARLQNINASVPLLVVGGNLRRSDGTSVIATGPGSIQMDPDIVYQASGASLAADIWASPERTLTGVTAANVTQIRGINLVGSGTPGDEFGVAA